MVTFIILNFPSKPKVIIFEYIIISSVHFCEHNIDLLLLITQSLYYYNNMFTANSWM